MINAADYDIKSEADRRHIAFVAVGQYVWGRGDTQEEAIAQLRRAGFSGRVKNRVRLLAFDPDTLGAHLDSHGGICWWGPGRYTARTL